MPFVDAILGPTPIRGKFEKKGRSSESKVEENNLNLNFRDKKITTNTPFSNFSNSLTSSLTDTGLVDFLSQSCEQIKDSTNWGVRELLKESSTLPPVLKADSEAMVEMGTAKTSRAKHERIENLSLLSFHSLNMLNVPSSSRTDSDR